MESLRGSGYTLGTALADIIDNSISAEATTVEIETHISQEGSIITISDDGLGMDEDEIIRAMTLAGKPSTAKRAGTDLGRFGLGLKTASFSQCRRLTVISKRDGQKPTGATWDLDRLEQSGWSLEIHQEASQLKGLNKLPSSGTVVVWEKIDQIDGVNVENFNEGIATKEISKAKDHLELVFHRFLKKGRDAVNLKLLLNNRELEPNDPFLEDHEATSSSGESSFNLGTNGRIKVTAFTIPQQKHLSPENWTRSGLDGGHIKNQGFYIYRAKRLLTNGGWLGIRASTAITKLSRVRVDIGQELDFKWKIDIRKSSAQVPNEVRAKLKTFVESMASGSIRIYDYKGRVTPASQTVGTYWNKIEKDNKVSFVPNVEHEVLKRIMDSTQKDSTKRELLKYIQLLGATLPANAIFAELGGRESQFRQSEISSDALEMELRRCFSKLESKDIPKDDIVVLLLAMEPFKSNEEQTKEILGKL